MVSRSLTRNHLRCRHGVYNHERGTAIPEKKDYSREAKDLELKPLPEGWGGWVCVGVGGCVAFHRSPALPGLLHFFTFQSSQVPEFTESRN